MPVQLRTGTPGDIRAMYELDLLCFDPPFRFDLDTMAHYASAANAIVIVAEEVAEEASRITGFVILNLETSNTQKIAYVTTLDVLPESRRQGLASLLMVEAETYASTLGVRAVTLHVSTENQAAINFYERSGYTRTKRHRNFYGETLDAWSYSKPIR